MANYCSFSVENFGFEGDFWGGFLGGENEVERNVREEGVAAGTVVVAQFFEGGSAKDIAFGWDVDADAVCFVCDERTRVWNRAPEYLFQSPCVGIRVAGWIACVFGVVWLGFVANQLVCWNRAWNRVV